MNAQPPKMHGIKITDLLKAWVMLVSLTLASFAMSYLEAGFLAKISPLIIAVMILLKSRIILTRYLGLMQTSAWYMMLSATIFIIIVICAGMLATL
ncbi:MAG: hypothetical protein OIF54_04800 [Cohaesibacter sp.]|nr:hypothetical protein [Cohaesibacter sp.]